MDKASMETYIAVLQHELVPAFGCTEPGAVAFAAASATEILKNKPDCMEIFCSGSIIKNVHSVTIPNAGGLKGVEAAAILGALVGNAEKQLCVLQDITSEQISEAERLLVTNYCVCRLAQNVDELYIRVWVRHNEDTAEVIVEGTHTNIVLATRNGTIVQEGRSSWQNEPDKSMLTLRGVLDFAKNCELSRIAPLLLRQIEENSAISREGLTGNYGVNVGRSLLEFYDGGDVRVRARAVLPRVQMRG